MFPIVMLVLLGCFIVFGIYFIINIFKFIKDKNIKNVFLIILFFSLLFLSLYSFYFFKGNWDKIYDKQGWITYKRYELAKMVDDQEMESRISGHNTLLGGSINGYSKNALNYRFYIVTEDGIIYDEINANGNPIKDDLDEKQNPYVEYQNWCFLEKDTFLRSFYSIAEASCPQQRLLFHIPAGSVEKYIFKIDME